MVCIIWYFVWNKGNLGGNIFIHILRRVSYSSKPWLPLWFPSSVYHCLLCVPVFCCTLISQVKDDVIKSV
jgi:hypothetical protein